jgi:hypothetical protein
LKRLTRVGSISKIGQVSHEESKIPVEQMEILWQTRGQRVETTIRLIQGVRSPKFVQAGLVNNEYGWCC